MDESHKKKTPYIIYAYTILGKQLCKDEFIDNLARILHPHQISAQA